MNNAVNQPSTSNHVANEPTRLSQVTPVPVDVHQIPEFDQDSWTVDNPLAGTEKATTDSPGNTQPPDQTNNNNNNNNNSLFPTNQATSQCSTANRVCTSSPASHPTDRILTLSRTADRAVAATTDGANSLTAASPLPELSRASNQTAEPIAGKTVTTNDMAMDTLTSNVMAAEPLSGSEIRELPASNGEKVQEFWTGSQAGGGSVETNVRWGVVTLCQRHVTWDGLVLKKANYMGKVTQSLRPTNNSMGRSCGCKSAYFLYMWSSATMILAFGHIHISFMLY